MNPILIRRVVRAAALWISMGLVGGCGGGSGSSSPAVTAPTITIQPVSQYHSHRWANGNIYGCRERHGTPHLPMAAQWRRNLRGHGINLQHYCHRNP